LGPCNLQFLAVLALKDKTFLCHRAVDALTIESLSDLESMRSIPTEGKKRVGANQIDAKTF